MSKAGGISYLIKHGRAPLPTVTRTTTPRTGIKKYAAGGTPINAPLNYDDVPDYTYSQADLETPEYDAFGKRIYRSGTLAHRGKDVAGLPAVKFVDPSAMIQGGGGGGDRSNSVKTNWQEVTGDLSIPADAEWNDLTKGQQMTARQIVDPYGIGGGLNSLISNSMLGKAATAFGGLMDRQMGRDVAPYTGATAPAANPMQRDPMQMAQQGGGSFAYDPRTGGTTSSGGPLSGAAWGENYSSGEAEAQARAADVNARAQADAEAGADARSAENADAAAREGERSVGGGGIDSLAGGGRVPHMAAGGVGSLAEHGGYSTSYAKGGRMLRGPGDGLSDHIPAIIGKDQPARLADGEFVVSADVVSSLGGGSTEAGSKKLYAMMDRIRKAAHGTKVQVKKVNDRKVLPA